MKHATSSDLVTMTEPQFVIFRTSNRKWRWRLVDMQRGTVLANSARAYRDRINCIEAINECEWSLRKDWSLRPDGMYWDAENHRAITRDELALSWGAAVKRFQDWFERSIRVSNAESREGPLRPG